MAFKIIIKEEARLDTQGAYDYYEAVHSGLGEDFLEELVDRYNNLSESPQHYGFIDDQRILRDIKVNRFPFVIIFEIIQDTVIVYAVHNTHRRPRKRL